MRMHLKILQALNATYLGVGLGLWAGALLLALPLSGCCSRPDCTPTGPVSQNPTPRITNPAPSLMTGTNLPTAIGTIR